MQNRNPMLLLNQIKVSDLVNKYKCLKYKCIYASFLLENKCIIKCFNQISFTDYCTCFPYSSSSHAVLQFLVNLLCLLSYSVASACLLSPSLRSLLTCPVVTSSVEFAGKGMYIHLYCVSLHA